MTQTKYKFQRMLEHLSVGDALGKICSKYSKTEILEIYGEYINTLRAPIRKASKYLWKEGAVTDDTILTLLVADSIINKKKFDRTDIGRRMLTCDPRGGTQIEKLKASNNPDYVASDGNTNGSAIRVLPISIINKDLKKLTYQIIDLTTLTHGNKESVACALVNSYAQVYVINSTNPKEPMKFIQQTAGKYYPQLAHTEVWSNICEAFSIAKHSKNNELGDKLEEKIGYNKYAWSSVPTAITLAFHSDNNYDALLQIIHRNQSGGDLDSVASMAGAIMGGIRADNKIQLMAQKIENVNQYNFQKYADELYKIRNIIQK